MRAITIVGCLSLLQQLHRLEWTSSETFFVDSMSIAVCVGGQTARFIPEALRPLMADNEEVRFSLFYNLQKGQDKLPPVFNTDGWFFGTPIYHRMPAHDALVTLQRIFDNATFGNIDSIQLQYWRPFNADSWKIYLGLKELNIISQFGTSQYTILNMYRYQQKCLRQISSYEARMQNKFDYVISTREDIYFLGKFDVQLLVSEYMQRQRCQILSKSCLRWEGFNMRLQLMAREVADNVLGLRIRFYKSLYNSSHLLYKHDNPEQFEYLQLLSLGYQFCHVPVGLYPVTAARYVNQSAVCFSRVESGFKYNYSSQSFAPLEPWELCVPSHRLEWLKQMACELVTSF